MGPRSRRGTTSGDDEVSYPVISMPSVGVHSVVLICDVAGLPQNTRIPVQIDVRKGMPTHGRFEGVECIETVIIDRVVHTEEYAANVGGSSEVVTSSVAINWTARHRVFLTLPPDASRSDECDNNNYAFNDLLRRLFDTNSVATGVMAQRWWR